MRSYPPRKTGTHTGWSPYRDRSAQRKFRALLIKRSGGWCEYPGCVKPGNVAHHDRAGYTADAGRYLCRSCHMRVDKHAR
jgi:hypothetical protein